MPNISIDDNAVLSLVVDPEAPPSDDDNVSMLPSIDQTLSGDILLDSNMDIDKHAPMETYEDLCRNHFEKFIMDAENYVPDTDMFQI